MEFLYYFASSLSFGRDSARYWQLIEILAVVSIVLWALVIFTALLRLTARLLWRHRTATSPNQNSTSSVTADS